MHTWRQKFLTWLLVSLMLLTLLPAAALASAPATIPLEQAIQAVKQNFIVPPEYTIFNSGFNESENRRAWSLIWSNPDDTGGNFGAQVDAGTGEIISMNCWKPETLPPNRIPSISLPQAQKIGIDLLQRLVPNRVSSMTLIPDSQVISLTSYGRSNYSVRWQRLVNNIPVLGEGANVEINADSGQVLGYNLNWSNLNMPAAAGVISSELARHSFVQEGIIQLQYVLVNNMRPLAARQKQSPLLVYRVDHPSNGAIDALTGKPIVPEANQWFSGGGGGGMYVMDQAKTASTIPKLPLSPQEKAEIDQTSGLISQEAAADAIKKWVAIPNNLRLQSANLEQDWRDPSQRMWNLSWSSAPSPASSLPSPTSSTQPLSIYGKVNAQTGDLLGFNLELPPANDSVSTMSQEAAQTLANDFLKKVQAQRFPQLKLDARSSDRENAIKIFPGADQSTWNVNYLRIVNGISFPGNGADIRVDRASQKIVAYNLNWVDSDFPSAQNVLGLNRANELYLQTAPLTLCYSTYYKAKRGLPEMSLVYQPQTPPGQPLSSMIDARSGEKLNEQGQPISQNLGVHVFNDIAGNFAEKEISLLGQAGVMSEYQDAFHPNESIKLVTLLRAMLDTASGIDNTRNLSDQDVIKRSLVLGWIKEDLSPDSSVSRGLLSQLMVRSLALEYLAQLPEIYQLPYQDSSSIGTDLKGYAALTWGLGIIRGDGVNFDPQHTISRAEAALALVKTLGTKTRP
ncbi:MAG: hypothetical protein CVU90_00190 [Firmicutes bacterium HGW-Firmicutes-15]|nr:MAG: hypothetical protein CVU90_00190 [Firmicutes bacterium HGW-Firmicutes-15]